MNYYSESEIVLGQLPLRQIANDPTKISAPIEAFLLPGNINGRIFLLSQRDDALFRPWAREEALLKTTGEGHTCLLETAEKSNAWSVMWTGHLVTPPQ